MKLTIILAGIAVIALTVVPALLDGQRRFRWGQDAEVIEMMERLNQFPETIGDWKTSAEVPLDDSSIKMLQPLTSISRVYFNAPNQLKANVFILMGPTGPTAAHTPDICFDSQAYQLIGQRRRISVDSNRRSESECFYSRFRSRSASGNLLASWYAWTVDGTWQAPDRPRFYFATSRYLFKIQIAITHNELQDEKFDEVLQKFAVDIEKTLRNTVF